MKKLINKLKLLFSRNRVVFAEYKGDIMTVVYSNGKKEMYAGSSTVWHKLPYMKRCNTLTECWLYDLWNYNKRWGGPYPDAHNN